MPRKDRPSLIGANSAIDATAVEEANGSNLLTQIIQRDAERNGRTIPLSNVPAEAPASPNVEAADAKNASMIANSQASNVASNIATKKTSDVARKLVRKKTRTLPSSLSSKNASEIESTVASEVASKNVSEVESYVASLRETPLAQFNIRIPQGMKVWVEEQAHQKRAGKLPNGEKVTQQSIAVYALELLIAKMQEDGK